MMDSKPPALRDSWRTLLFIGLVVTGIIIYVYAWRFTDIDLDETQDVQRQQQLTRAMRELLSPNIFEQDVTSERVDYPIRMGCVSDPLVGLINPAPPLPIESGDPYLVVSANCAEIDQVIFIEGYNFRFEPRGNGILRWRRNENQSQPLTRFDVGHDGTFKLTVKVPRFRFDPGEIQQIEAENFWPKGTPRLSSTTHLVIEKMIETIFLALMATTLAVPVAAALSFLAARNLMKQVTLPLGNVLVGVVLLPVGILLGVWFLKPIGVAGIDLGRDSVMEVVGTRLNLGALHPLSALIFLVGVLVIYSRAVPMFVQLVKDQEPPAFVSTMLSVATNVVLMVVVLFTMGVLSGLSQSFGEWLAPAEVGRDARILSIPLGWLIDEPVQISFSTVGHIFRTLGEFYELVNGLVAAAAGAIFVAFVGSNLALPILKRIHGLPSFALAGVLGGISGALVMGLLALMSEQGAFLGLLLPVVAAVLGAQTLVLLSYVITDPTGEKRNRHADQAVSERLIRSALAILGAVLAFALAYYYMNVARAILDGRRPLEEDITLLGMTISMHLWRGLLLGGILGAINGALTGVHTSFPLGMAVYNTTRTVLNATRAIEPLIMGIVFVIWVGIGPFAGMLALALHSVAALGKLYSEQVENIDTGPIEAIQATGANRLQTIVYAVVPQIVPPYIAFTMYRWDVNVRMSTIIGFVGGGGIGFILQQQINLLQYEDAGVAVLAIAIVVSVLDYASAYIREKMI